MSPEALAEKLIQARLERRKVALSPDERPTSWLAAREAADMACIGEPHAWKLGGTTQPVRDIFGISMPFYGPLGGHEVFEHELRRAVSKLSPSDSAAASSSG